MFRFLYLLLDTTKIIVGSQEDLCYGCLLQHIVQISRYDKYIPFPALLQIQFVFIFICFCIH